LGGVWVRWGVLDRLRIPDPDSGTRTGLVRGVGTCRVRRRTRRCRRPEGTAAVFRTVCQNARGI